MEGVGGEVHVVEEEQNINMELWWNDRPTDRGDRSAKTLIWSDLESNPDLCGE